ncbi:MAG: hypothetical protein EOO23_00230, partial [Comamonadaceae bacterium]
MSIVRLLCDPFTHRAAGPLPGAAPQHLTERSGRVRTRRAQAAVVLATLTLTPLWALAQGGMLGNIGRAGEVMSRGESAVSTGQQVMSTGGQVMDAGRQAWNNRNGTP